MCAALLAAAVRGPMPARDAVALAFLAAFLAALPVLLAAFAPNAAAFLPAGAIACRPRCLYAALEALGTVDVAALVTALSASPNRFPPCCGCRRTAWLVNEADMLLIPLFTGGALRALLLKESRCRTAVR
jgi:hypothetical protein